MDVNHVFCIDVYCGVVAALDLVVVGLADKVVLEMWKDCGRQRVVMVLNI